jgi:hypothetical protein
MSATAHLIPTMRRKLFRRPDQGFAPDFTAHQERTRRIGLWSSAKAPAAFSFLLRHSWVSSGGHWTLAHRRWLGDQRFDDAAQQIVLQEGIHAIEDSLRHRRRLETQLALIVPEWSMRASGGSLPGDALHRFSSPWSRPISSIAEVDGAGTTASQRRPKKPLVTLEPSISRSLKSWMSQFRLRRSRRRASAGLSVGAPKVMYKLPDFVVLAGSW